MALMPLLDKIREKTLIELAMARYNPDLTPAELKVLRDSASSVDPDEPEDDTPRPPIRPEFVRWLATDPEAAPHIDPKGLRVYAATIPGKLDLRGCHVHPTLDFRRCEFREKVYLRSAETPGLYILDSSLAEGMSADGVIVHGPLFLRRIHSEGEIRLLGARNDGNFECDGAKLRAKGNALSADGATIGGNVFLRDGFESEGEIRLLGAEITGQLNCSGAKLKATSNALYADGAKIGGSVLLNDGFESEGVIRLLGAEITGQLNCNGAKLRAKGNALYADAAKIGGAVFLTDGFESEGDIRLLGAEITGQLNCSGAKLKATSNALYADRAKIGGSVFLMGGFESEGEIRLPGAEITGQLNCNGAKLKATSNALYADGAKIGGSVLLMDGFESEGAIRLLGAEIGGDLAIRGAKVAGVACLNTVVTGDLIWQSIEKSEETDLNLMGAKVKNLRDDRVSWPNEGRLDIDGLVYEELTLHEPASDEIVKAHRYARELPLSAGERIDWIMLQRPDRRTEPQPWMQLRDLLERKGDRKGAKYVLFRFRCLQAQKSWIPWRWLRIAFAWLEENPLRIGYSILFTLALGTLVFAGAARSGAMIETVTTQPNMIATYAESAKGTERKPDESIKPVSIHYTSFQPFIYTLENAVPLVKLGMDERWMPDLQHQPQPWFPQIGWLDGLKWLNSYGFLVWFRWLLIVSGWVQATVFVASVADRFRK
jgi:hypothetical protein